MMISGNEFCHFCTRIVLFITILSTLSVARITIMYKRHSQSMSLAKGGGRMTKKMIKCDTGGGGLSERVM